MWLLWLSFLLGSVLYSKAEFGTPYLKNSRMCEPWRCVTRNLGLPNELPLQKHYEDILKTRLPEKWHRAVETAVNVCYSNKPRVYVNTCSGQALLHCTLDNLIENCPEEYWRRDDACYPVSTIAGMNYMFTQSRYQDLEKNLPNERRPAWFMRQYFNSKCCNLPKLINSTDVTACGFETFLRYYEHEPKEENLEAHYMSTAKPKATAKASTLEVMPLQGQQNSEDPLECCDMKDFIAPSWRSKCGFKLSWEGSKRLTISEPSEQSLISTTTVLPKIPASSTVNRDVKIVPLSCEQETCVFRKLNVISDSGVVDKDAFSKFLDNFTTLHPSWVKAKARVITQCLSKKSSGYNAECEINEVLGCTLDVFSENCPHKSKHDDCKHSRRNNTVCQISFSKYRPKNRRTVCGLPHLVDSAVLTECGVISVSQIEYVTEVPVRKSQDSWHNKYTCQDSTPSTLCLMKEMAVLNRYSFMDYFKMKDRIRSFTSRYPEWFALTEVYMNTFTALPMYKEYCSSPKKLLNVIDAMLMTCPISKRKSTPQCVNFFKDIATTPPSDNRNITKEKLDEILQNLYHILPPTTPKASSKVTRDTTVYTKKNAVFDYGILNSKYAPTVRTIDVKTSRPPLVLLPVYMRSRSTLLSTAQTLGPRPEVFRSTPFLLHGGEKTNSTNNITWKPFFVV